MGIRLKKKRKREEAKKKEEDYALLRQNSEFRNLDEKKDISRQNSKLSDTSAETKKTNTSKALTLDDTDEVKSQHSDNVEEGSTKSKIFKRKKTFLTQDFRCERSYFMFS